MPNFKPLSQKKGEKSPENDILETRNDSIKSMSNTTKFELDLCYVKTNSCTEFQVNMWKDDEEKSGKQILAKGKVDQTQ